MSAETLDLREMAGIARRHAKKVFFLTLLGVGGAWALSTVVPKKFKTLAVLNIQNSYFQSPVPSDLGTSVDQAEVQTQKQSLLQLAINDDYVETLGEKFKVFKAPAESPERTVERDQFRKNIEFFPMNANLFQIAVTARDARASFNETNEVLNQIVGTLINERTKIILRYRDSLQKEVEEFRSTMRSERAGPAVAATQADTIRRELRNMESRIATLKSQYTEEHPKVLDLEADAQALRQRLKNAGGSGSNGKNARKGSRPVVRAEPVRNAKFERYDELTRKIKNLDIALELEKNKQDLPYLTVIRKPVLPVSAISPKVSQFMLVGAILGLLLSLILIGFQELRRSSSFTPELAAQMLSLPLMGTLPPFREQDPDRWMAR